jgi:hypothetical protein
VAPAIIEGSETGCSNITSQGGAKVLFDRRKLGLEELRSGNDHQIDTYPGLVATESLSYQSFSSIPRDRAADPARSSNPEPGCFGAIRKSDERYELTVTSGAALLDAHVVGPAPDALVRPQAL